MKPPARSIPSWAIATTSRMWDATGPMMIDQLDHASERLAGAWIAAWREAGKPKLPTKCATFLWDK